MAPLTAPAPRAPYEERYLARRPGRRRSKLEFSRTPLEGAWLVDLQRLEDDRGFFARAWCRREFEQRGLVAELVQANLSHNHRKGTIRGLHYQMAPFGEAKLVRCIRGAIWDVIVDVRPDSPTYREWFGVELTSENRRQLYVPEGFAHGYQTLADDSDVLYHVSQFYSPEAERGIRWNDPQFAITWPHAEGVTVSSKDRHWPDFTGAVRTVGVSLNDSESP